MTLVVTADAPPAEALELNEASEVRTDLTIPADLKAKYASDLAENKMLPIVVIRPGLGRGRGRHLYEPQMLQENAHKFVGWKMYVNHLSPSARKAMEGLPRPMEHIGGILKETWWDPTYPAEGRFGQGAVVGLSKPNKLIRDLVDIDPALVETSISANATSVKPITHDGAKAWLVEGIEDKGSVDWVTEAGAGGQVLALMEAAYTEEEQMALMEQMTDEEFVAYVAEKRPHLIEAVDEEKPEPEAPAEEPAPEEAPAPEAEPAPEAPVVQETTDNKETGMEFTPEKLQEALQSESFAGVLDKLVNDQIEAKLPELVEAAIAEERDLIRAEAKADAGREIELRDLRDKAHQMIAESKLPEAFQQQVRTKFSLTESGPTEDLDVVDVVDADGKVEKKAQAVLTEAVEAEIKTQRDLLAAANPTRVKGQGPSTSLKEGEEAKQGDGTFYGAVLSEAGVDASTAWA